MISEATEELIRAHWAAQIPAEYRFTGRDHSASNHACGAIIAAPPPVSMLTKFFASLGPLHLTKSQLAANAARENCGRPGHKKGQP